MKKEARFVWVLLAAVILSSGACQHKPAYSDIDANKTSRSQNQNVGTQVAAAEPQPGESPAPQTSPSAPQRPAFQAPSFLDRAKGGIKDLPQYPRSYQTNVQFGAIQGVNTATFLFSTSDPMDKIAPFFEQAIKNNNWTVKDKILDPEFSEWTLEKGKDDSAKVRVSKGQRGAMSIMIVRGEKLEEPAK